MESLRDRTVKDMVTEDYRTAAVFEKYSIDFCCGGKKSLETACAEQGVNVDSVLEELGLFTGMPDEKAPGFAGWDLDRLVQHIMEKHHSYVRRSLPVILAHTRKIADVHGTNHPELLLVADRFRAVAGELGGHMEKEETILFPYIDGLAKASRGGWSIDTPPFRTIRNPVRMMEMEHQSAGDGLYEIREATGGYRLPADGCTTYQVTLKELEEFEQDLHQHVHLENNILFPKAIGLEEMLLSGRG